MAAKKKGAAPRHWTFVTHRNGREVSTKFSGSLTAAKAAAKVKSKAHKALVEVYEIREGWPVFVGQWRGHDRGGWSQE